MVDGKSVSLRDICKVVLSHPFDKKNRMDGARSVGGLQKLLY
jgi:hypothetical protein